MNMEQFTQWMHAVDDELLEEAQKPPAPAHHKLWTVGALAACFCVLLAAGRWQLPDVLHQAQTSSEDVAASENTASPEETVTMVNPMREVTAEEVAALGYEIPLPEGAADVSYTVIDGTAYAAPLVEVTFTQDSADYSCRALKSEGPEDISGIYDQWTECLDWTVDNLSMQMRQSNSGAAWVGWYAADQGTQWCLSGDGDGLSLLHTAQSIVESLGYQLAVAPAEAENVIYNAFALDGLTVGETVFALDGVTCSYRMAATWEIEEDFADLSEADGPFDQTDTAELQWCQAKLFWNEGGEGKIIWFDVVPGLLYSLHMEQNASREALVDLASQLFVPAQGEVG